MRRLLAVLCGCLLSRGPALRSPAARCAAAFAALLLAAAGARAQELPAAVPSEELPMPGIARDLYPGPMRVQDARGEARPFAWLRLFGASRGFRLDGSLPAYDLEGGAALDLGGGLAVTGGYRVLGLGWSSDPPEPSAAPLLGLRLSF
jgi:hypothetical protein